MLLGAGWHLGQAPQAAVARQSTHRRHHLASRPRHAPGSAARVGLHHGNGPTLTAAGSRTDSGVEISEGLTETGGGGRGGHSGDNGTGGGGGGGDGSRGGPSGFGGYAWGLLVIAAGATAVYKGSQHAKLDWRWGDAGSQGPAGAASSGGGAAAAPGEEERVVLRRLVQEAFADLVKVRARLDELEDVTGIAEAAPSEDDPDATPLASGGAEGGVRKKRSRASRGPLSSSAAAGGRQGRHHLGTLAGNLEMGGGLLWAPEDRDMGDLLPAAGVKVGADLTLRMRGAPREGQDAVLAELRLNPSTEQLSLKKVLYYLQMAPWLRLALAPFGATGQDTAYTLNPLAGQGLSAMIRHGCPLHQRPLGSLVGASLDLKKAWASAGYALQGTEGGGLRTAVLGQALVSASSTVSLGLSLLQHQTTPAAGGGAADAPPAAAAAATPRSGLLQVTTTPRGILSTPRGGGFLGSPAWEGITPRSSSGAGAAHTAAGTLLGAMFAWRPDPDVVVHGWASADGAAMAAGLKRSGLQGMQPEQWGVSLGSYPDGSGNGWAVGLGRSSAVASLAGSGAAAGGGSADGGGVPNLFELSLQFSGGEGMVVSPGVLCAVQGGRTTLFAGLKTSWDW